MNIFENYLENKANIVNKPLPVGDVKKTYADTSYLKNLINDHQNIGHIYTPQRKQSKYLNNKYQKYKKLRESLNNIW